jgi:hypothetical protein
MLSHNGLAYGTAGDALLNRLSVGSVSVRISRAVAPQLHFYPLGLFFLKLGNLMIVHCDRCDICGVGNSFYSAGCFFLPSDSIAQR